MSVKLTAEEIKLRGSLLAKNKELLKLHKDLVFSNILSEEEFWEDRRGLLKAQEMALKQKKGVTSALVSDDLKPVTSSGSTATTGSDVKYVLTPTIIQTIFQQHPILKKAFTELVKISGEEEGKPLSEREFWIEYFKSKFFNESLNSQQKISGSIHLDTFYHEDSISTNESSDKSIIPLFSSQLDISRSEDDHVSDYIRYEREASANGSAWNSLRQFNKHSLRVLESTRSSENHHQSSANTLYNYIEIPDLQEFHPPLMVPLNIQESQLFSFKTSNLSVDNDTGRCEDLKRDLKMCLDRFDTEEFDPKQFQLNYLQHKNLFTNIHNRNNFIISSEIEASTSSSSSSSNLNLNDEEVNYLLNSATEILRHFWKSALTNPVSSSSPDQTAKLTRFISVLEKMETKFVEVDGEIFRNLKETIDRAKSKYSEIMIKTNAKITNK